MILVFITFIYLIGYLTSINELYFLSGAVLMFGGLILYWAFYKKSGMILCPAALFSVAWICGQGISCLKLSKLQVPWENKTWICFYVISIFFFASYELFDALLRKRCPLFIRKSMDKKNNLDSLQLTYRVKAVKQVMYITAAISVTAFVIEACLLGYIPLFTVDTPHAYSYFHISGVHYFTVSCVLLPSLAVIYINELYQFNKHELSGKYLYIEVLKTGKAAVFMFLLGLVLPILLVSRFQMLFGIILAAFTFLLIRGGKFSDFINKRTLPLIISGFAFIVLIYVFITIERAHSVEYLNGIFEMKNSNMPIWITQPYIYIANNFDNFNCLVRDLPEYAKGLRMLFPFFALTGLKFVFPELTAFPLYVTKTELTTVTLFYDAYYDFGIIGCALFATLLGIVLSILAFLIKQVYLEDMDINPILYLIAAQLLFYCMFAFFTTWYSNPTTWFYLIFSLMICLYTSFYMKMKSR
ncbi:MAG: O-antigen polymerase [Eubacteriales bacterium]|nr:O-antigen polymerase [Eubacteriales bacterium]